jgi:DSF synthase
MLTQAQTKENIIDFNSTKRKELKVHYDLKYQAVWYFMNASPRPCFTLSLLKEILDFYNDLENIDHQADSSYKYMVLASNAHRVFNLGGDLSHFKELIQRRNRDALSEYAKTCIEAIYRNHTGLDSRITSIALIQGDALGGGFEAALSSNVIIAERGAKIGLPEILFNLFPGMGAYSFLSRKVGSSLAEKIITSGKLYSASELFDKGIIDILAEDGEGTKALYDYINGESRHYNGIRSLREAQRHSNPVTYSELTNIAEIWVDASLRLRDKDLKMMDRLVARQNLKTKPAAA